MSEEQIKFINWIGLNQFYKSSHTGFWVRNSYLYGNVTHSDLIAKTIEELYELYKVNQ